MDVVPVTRMLRNLNVNSDNFDFDDILRRFERRFGSSTFRSANLSDLAATNDSIGSNELHSERDSGSDDGNVSDHTGSAKGDATDADTTATVALTTNDFDNEISRFLASFCTLPRVRYEATGIQHIDDDNLVHVAKSTVHVSRQVIRRELQHLIHQLPEMSQFLGGHGTSGNRAIIASLKRQVRERKEEFEQVSRVSKRREVEMRNLRDRLSDVAHERDKAIVDRVRALEEKQKLLDRVEVMTEAVEKYESQGEKIFYERQRLERYVGVLRKELLGTHHERNAIQLEYSLLLERMKELERRNEENWKSESIIVPKVRELHLIQQEMLELMTQVDSGNVGARGALNILNKKRTKILSRIATVVTKRTGATNNSQSGTGAVSGHGRSNRDGDDKSSPNMNSSRANDTGTESPGAHDQFTETHDRPRPHIRSRPTAPRIPSPGTLQRKMTNMLKGNGWADRRPNIDSSATVGDREYERTEGNSTGDGSSPASGSVRNKYSALRYAGARAHEQAISDLAALRDLVELREKELRRVEDELERARDKSNMLERELYYERQNRRRENRNLHGAELTEAFEMVELSRQAHTAHNTLFDWQNNPAPGDGEKTAAIPKPVLEDEDEACLSPVSEDSRSFGFGLRKIG